MIRMTIRREQYDFYPVTRFVTMEQLKAIAWQGIWPRPQYTFKYMNPYDFDCCINLSYKRLRGEKTSQYRPT